METSGTHPNILFIMADDHATNAISAYGSRLAEVFRTPNLDRIAEEGCRLENCCCTNAICTPSRAVILTGKSSHITGVRTLSDAMNPEEITFPRLMQDAGYQTSLFGKWHVHSEPRGFDDYSVLPGQGRYFDPGFITKGMEWPENPKGENDEYPSGLVEKGYVTDLITDKCVEWIEDRDQDRPFLLLCHHKAPHDDFEYHPRDEDLFEGIFIPEPENLREDRGHRSIASRDYGTSVSERNPVRNAVQHMSQPDYPTGSLSLEGLNPDERTRAAYQKYLKDYLRVCKGLDDNVGRLLECLDQKGLADNTIVIYTSDQGMFLGEHDYIDKRWIYEEALKMPFLVRYPEAIPARTIIDSVVTNLDFAPTILDMAGLSAPEPMQGRSFLSIIQGQDPSDWPGLAYNRYWMHRAHHDVPAHYGLRTLKYKIIFFYGLPLDANDASPDSTPAGWELYDLVDDPDENHNLFDHPAYKELRSEAIETLMAERRRLGEDDSPYPELLQRFSDSLKGSHDVL